MHALVVRGIRQPAAGIRSKYRSSTIFDGRESLDDRNFARKGSVTGANLTTHFSCDNCDAMRPKGGKQSPSKDVNRIFIKFTKNPTDQRNFVSSFVDMAIVAATTVD